MTAPKQPGGHGWRTPAEALALVVVLTLLLVGADLGARAAAESLVARAVQDAAGLAERPQVQVRGAVFLPQVLRGAYREVDVSTVGLSDGPLRIDRVESKLTDVRVTFHDVLLRDVQTIGIGRSEETVTLLYPDLNSYLKATGRPFQINSTGNDEVSISGSLDVLDQHLNVSGNVSLNVANGELRITPREVRTGSATLSQVSRLLLGQRLTLAVPMDALPFGHELVSVEASPQGVRLEAVGTAIIVRP